ncbi:Zn-dependent hydrolase [Bosea sp. PAMC 26642]|uniref:Zn-dependent hydrolase n=1 Tax=Bosea sp. (strain PAMC 26642) TaxID=1792307 RepID=UPI0007705D64|nr:Zn-dependent hydrolase [Bosea sp. PAMC 26642]AMJ63192.1 allantoate amidohydrolase [Bosea sp. PAMC 26642]
MTAPLLDTDRLLSRIRELGGIGRDSDRLIRLAASDADKAGRDQIVAWLGETGLDVAIDRIGNIFGVWSTLGNAARAPVLIGSHIDTVIDAGIYDGCYGVLAGLEVIAAMKQAGLAPARPLAVAAFTNEEGVRYAPDMLGSLVHAGGLDIETALAVTGTDGSVLGAELARIGYSGRLEPGFLKPHAYIELHIEQGPVLEREGFTIGAVASLQGISWQRIAIDGVANHAGTTPMAMRRDAGVAAARVVTFLRDRARTANTPTVATVGTMAFEPNAINVIPSRATFTVDLRDPDPQRLRDEEAALAAFLDEVAAGEEVSVSVERLARFEPVVFDEGIVVAIEAAARARGLSCRRMVSGAGHDAQMMARIAPSAMIFVPSVGGISHNPAEFTAEADLVAGIQVLLDVVMRLAMDE